MGCRPVPRLALDSGVFAIHERTHLINDSFHTCQLEGDFFIRRTQANIAMEMISPASGENSVMQVNMGEGKSSVIVPIVAAALADGHRLVRVIVPKPLRTQMMHLLVDRLGGLANRPVYQLTFSRANSNLEAVTKILSECVEERGVLLVSPEDVLSLKLTSVESQVSEPKFSTPSSSKLIKSIDYDVLVTSSLEFVRMTITGSTMFDLADRPSIAERILSRHYITGTLRAIEVLDHRETGRQGFSGQCHKAFRAPGVASFPRQGYS